MQRWVGERLHLPGGAQGTVSAAEPGRFRVTWDDPQRQRGQPRSRIWYRAGMAGFRPGNYRGESRDGP